MVPTIAALKTGFHALESERYRLLAMTDAQYNPIAENLRQVAQMLADQIALRTGKEP